MDTGLDLTTASREALLALIAQQQAVITELQRRLEVLEGKAKPGGSPRMPGIKPKSGQGPARDKRPRKPRPHGFARQRMAPTHRVEHVLESCPQCGTGLAGGWVQRTREVIDLPLVPAQVTEHVFIARTCPVCERRRTPQADLGRVALGKHRLGVNLLSRIAALREEGRLPLRTIQWYLQTVHRLPLSLGAIVRAIHQVAQKAQPALAEILDRIRGSPVVHADETGWRQDGVNGYVWTFSTPTDRYFLRRGRNKEVVDEALGDSFSGVWVSDFYAAYHHYPGLKQQQRRGTEPAALGGQPQNQRRHPLSPRHRLQVDPRLPLRHLARPGPGPPPVLPATTHFPLTLNCYGRKRWSMRQGLFIKDGRWPGRWRWPIME